MRSSLMGRMVLILMSLPAAGCSNQEVQTEPVQATISDLRMTFVVLPLKSSQQGNPIAGALIGHAVAGKTGAFVGALASADRPGIEATGKLIACGFTATLADGRTFTFRLTNHGLARCSLFRDGSPETFLLFRDGRGLCWTDPDPLYDPNPPCLSEKGDAVW